MATYLGALPGVEVLDAERLGLPPHRHDATRLVLDVHRLGMTGLAAERALRGRFGIAPEMSDLRGVVCLVTIGDTPGSVDRLVAAFAALARERRPAAGGERAALRSAGEVMAPGEQALTPREAFFAPTRAVPLQDAVGEVAAELVVPYPPGVPALAPGEVVSSAKAGYLREVVGRGGFVRGAADPTLAKVRVVGPGPLRAGPRSCPSRAG